MALIAWDTTPATANCYVTLTQAKAYFVDAIHGAAWDAANEQQKAQALVTATRILDRVRWVGDRASSSQALQWPRTGATDRNGTAILSTAVPTEVREATYELALALLESNSLQSGTPAVTQISDGRTSVTFARASKASTAILSPVVDGLIRHLKASYSVGRAPVAYGTDETEHPGQFDDEDQWDRTEAL